MSASSENNAEQEQPPQINMEEIVTEEVLSAILTDYNKNQSKSWTLVEWSAVPGTVAGDNYMSLIYAVKMTLKRSGDSNEDVTETLPVMLKVLPRNEYRVKMINEAKIFLRDVSMYEKIIPEMESFQRDHLLSEEEMCLPWPHCYSYKTDGKEDYLAMEDLKVKGFKMASRKEGLDFEHCRLVLQTQARFHAISYAMFGGDFDGILERFPWLEETMTKEENIPDVWKNMTDHTFQQQAATLREMGEELGAHLVEKIYSDDYWRLMHELLGGKKRWAVIGHGDCWTNNLLFRYDPETNLPVEVKFVDYQVTRVCSRAVDFHYFLYSSPQIQVLNEREPELRQIYFDEFTRFAQRLGVDVEGQQLTKENFLEEIELIRYYGVVTGFMLALVTSADQADVPELDNFKEEDLEKEGENGAKNFLLNMMKERALLKIKNLAGVHLPKVRQMQKHMPPAS